MIPYHDKKNTVTLAFLKNDGPDFTRPIVTIGVCVKNCEASVKEAMVSILDQDFPHKRMEVIFVDDGSQDRTLPVILDSLLRMDMQVKVFHSKWRGLGPARNSVVDNASGKYIVWVDGDMILPSDHVRKQVEFMQRNPNVGIAKARYGMLHGENLVATLENIKFLVEDARAKNGLIPTSKLPGTGGSIYRVEAIRRVGGFDNHIKGVGEDQDAAYRIKAAGWLLYRTSAVFYERRGNTWKAFWDKYFWYGYSSHYLYCKNRRIFSIHKMVPVTGFVIGLLYSIIAYGLMRRKVAFLLPLYFAFTMTAWISGFAGSQIDSYKPAHKIHWANSSLSTKGKTRLIL